MVPFAPPSPRYSKTDVRSTFNTAHRFFARTPTLTPCLLNLFKLSNAYHCVCVCVCRVGSTPSCGKHNVQTLHPCSASAHPWTRGVRFSSNLYWKHRYRRARGSNGIAILLPEYYRGYRWSVQVQRSPYRDNGEWAQDLHGRVRVFPDSKSVFVKHN